MATKGGPSPHLTWAELACHDGTAYPARWRETRAAALAEAFEAVRELAGGLPLFVTSGYRTAAWNQRIGGAAKSQHVQGRAVDVVPAKGCSIDELAVAAAAVRRSRRTKLAGIGVYRGFVHLDVRPWRGQDRWPTWGDHQDLVLWIRRRDEEGRDEGR